VNKLVRGFRSQSGIHRHHRKDVEINIEIKRGRFRLPVLMVLIASIREGENRGNARDYVRTLGKWLGTGRKDPDRLDPHRRIESDGCKLRTTGRLESAPFQ